MKKKLKIDEILLIDKPKGITSFDVIRRLRKKLGVRKTLNTSCRVKMGHAGTLDPLATGLLIVGVGDGTKKLKDLIGLSKQYEVEVLLGLQTDTGDMEGKIVESLKVGKLESDAIKNVVSGLVGKLKLPVPVYSAIKRGGESLYKKARRGEKFDVPIKEMEIYKVVLRGHKSCNNGYILEIIMDVSSGTYVRSVAEEIGRRLDYPATVKELRRTKVGEYRIEDAMTINDD